MTMKMLQTLKTITRRLVPDRSLLETPPQAGVNVLAQIRFHCSMHRLLGQQLRCSTLRKSFE
jgi:hypothetical protein